MAATSPGTPPLLPAVLPSLLPPPPTLEEDPEEDDEDDAAAGDDDDDDAGDPARANDSPSPPSASTEVRDDSIERCTRFRSARSSPAVWHRRSRSFSSALLIVSSSFTGSCGRSRVAVVGVRFRIASVITAEVSPRNGTTPVAISYSTTPNENRSVRPSSSLPRNCSGDMYATVPTAVPGLVRSRLLASAR